MMRRLAVMGCTILGGLASIPAASAVPLTMVAPLAASASASFNVVLPLRDKAGLEALVAKQQDPNSSLYHHWLTPQQVDAQYGADPATIKTVTAALQARGLSVTARGRMLTVSGTASRLGATLQAPLATGRSRSGVLHTYATTIPVMPSELRKAGAILIGLSKDPHEARPFSRKTGVTSAQILDPKNRYGGTGPYWYGDLKQAYQYPSYQTMITKGGQQVRLDGTGATVGIVMSSDIYDSDVEAVFNHEHFMKNSGQAANPKLYKRVAINGGGTLTGSALGEASLDVQEAITGAPGSHVILYSMPSLSNSNILTAYQQVIEDNEADVVSSSFGGCELFYTAAYNDGTDYTSELQVEHELFVQGNAQGITFLASSGDEAGLECTDTNYIINGTNGKDVPSVSTPANDPNVTAVGGTNVVTNAVAGSLDSAYVRENAYSDPLNPEDPYGVGATISNARWGAGGGVSVVFAKPSFQNIGGINTGSAQYRAIPDIGMQVGGCPGGAPYPCTGGNSALNGNGNQDRSAVAVAVNGSFEGLIGTSVASPEFAGVVALLVETSGRMGNLNTYLYTLGATQAASGSNNLARATTYYHRSIPGYNGVVTNNQPVNTRGKYYNYTVGVGTPVVYRLVGASNAVVAGTPQTATNP